MTAAQTLAAWAVGLRRDELPEFMRRAVCRHLLDGIGNALGARRLGFAQPAITVAEGLAGPPEARMLTGSSTISAPAAALATGTLVHALDFDDTHGVALVHPTSVVLPAALAVGQQVGATGAAVITAAAAGLEAACRLGAAVPHGFHARGVHATAAVGPLAAAITAGLLTDMSVEALVNALGIAGSSAGGLLEFLDTGADTKTLHPGISSLNGVLATRLAGAGAQGPVSVLEGRRGLWAALTDVAPDVFVVTDGLGTRWEASRIGVKPYPNCQLMHASIDALRAALPQTVVHPTDVEHVAVHLHPDSLAVVGERRTHGLPRSTYDAKFDVAWSLAALLTDGAITVDTYTENSIRRPEIATLATRVELVALPQTAQPADSGAEVQIHVNNGTTYIGAAQSSSGTAARPLSDDQLISKFVGNAGDHPAAPDLVAEVLDLASAPSLDQVFSLAAECATSPTTRGQ